MRKSLLILSALLLMGSLLAIPSLNEIKTHDYGYVNRIVIVFSSRVDYQIESKETGKNLQIKVFNAAKSASFQAPKLVGNQTLQSVQIEFKKTDILINLIPNMPFRYEKMTLNEEGYKIVLDVFQKEPPATFEAGLGVANFYQSTHQFNKAKPLYSKLETNYPDHKEINYYIGKNLIGMKKYDEAISKLQKIPTSSREYEFGQMLVNNLKSLKSYADFPSDFLDSSFDNALNSPAQAASATPTEQTVEKTSEVTSPIVQQPKATKRSLLEVLSLAQIPLWLALILIFLLIIFCIIALNTAKPQEKREAKPYIYKESPKEPSIFVDEEAKRKIVSKLLHDGWSNKEIAKELHISEREVESTVKQLSVSDF